MPWISGAIIAGGSLLGGLFDDSGDQADAAMQQEARFREQEIGIQRDSLQFSKDVYGDHKAKFDPLFDDIRGMMDDVEPDYGAIAGDINMSFDTARGMEERNQRRYGIKPTDGAARQAQRDYGIRRGAAHVGARSAARQGAKDKRYGRYADLYNSGQGIGSSSASMVSSSMNNLGQAYGRNANAAGNNAAYYNQQGAQNAQGWGQALGSVDWGSMFNSARGWFNNSSSGSGGGTSGGSRSDVRLKENIEFVGMSGDIKIYQWDWNALARSMGVNDPTIGVLAHEHLDSGFVRERDGFLDVDYDGLFSAQQARVAGAAK